MSDEPIVTSPADNAAEPEKRKPSRWRRFFLRHVPLGAAATALFVAALLAGLYFWMSSSTFEDYVRRRLIATLEESTGGRVEIASFHWKLLHLEAEADGLVLHGTEDANEEPLARVARLDVKLSILNLLSPRILLRSIELTQPTLHTIVYQDGSTNLPTPRRKQRANKSALEQLFALKAGHAALRQGILHSENRASSFDFQDRYEPIAFSAEDFSLTAVYVSGKRSRPEFYRIEAGATDIDLTHSGAHSQYAPVHGFFRATLELERNAARLQSLRITARGRDRVERSLEISGTLTNFAHPKWQAKVGGELDMRLIEPITGYPHAPEGVLRVDLAAQGGQEGFSLEGPVHIEDGAYVGTGVVARGLRLDARVHANAKRLLIDSIVVRLRQGGTMEGVVDLAPWLVPDTPSAPAVHTANRTIAPPPTPDSIIPMDGRVDAVFKGVSLDTLLEMVSPAPYQHLGFNTQLNGTALAQWSKGKTESLSVAAKLDLNAPARGVSDEVPANGVVDATYTQNNGAVALRKLELHLPSSDLVAHGAMGAYPLASSSSFAVDFRSHNLSEFDTVLRDLGVQRAGRAGAAALPLALGGQAEFHGLWSGSLRSPQLAGNIKASKLSFEMLPFDETAKTAGKQTRWEYLDSIDAAGSYSDARIVIDHAQIARGAAHLAVSGSLEAVPGRVPAFTANSVVHLRLQAEHLHTNDVLPVLDLHLPVSGILDAQLQVDGPLHAPNGSGWMELSSGTVYGEPVRSLRAQGTLNAQVVHVKSLTAALPAGNFSGEGSYDLHARSFQGEMRGTGIEISKLGWMQQQNAGATGKLAFMLHGGGTVRDPRLEISATLAEVTLRGEPLGSFHATARTANRAISYAITSRMKAAELSARGWTGFDGGYPTQASLNFTRFNIGALLKLAHINGLSGSSSIAGSVAISGPLARKEQLRGEARLQEVAATLSGVHLKSEGGIHALLANGFVHLDPLHITGENTDIHLGGDLALTGSRQLNINTSGRINLKLLETLDPDLTASGSSAFQMEAHGPLANPGLRGRIEIENGALATGDLSNGLSQMHGTLLFNQNRLEVKQLTATSGGGQVNVTGSLSYQNGFYTDLTATGKGVRIRYPQGISSLADTTLRLAGQRNNLLLSGNITLTRFIASPDLDIASLAAQAGAVKATPPPNAPSNHVRLDVRIVSSPQLNFQNAFAKLAGDVDLHLRGTLATPSLLGRISISEGSARIAGTRYDLQRGEITFTNPVRIEPSIDLNATARVEDYDIALGLHGTPEKMAVSYRSDPPLPEADVVALLALGRTENQQRIYTQQQVKALSNPTTDALLGGALNATVSSRVQKLFGAGSVKVDPNYLGALGNSTSRIIVEEQLGRNLTLTYATNVNTTGQQLLQAEVAINRHVSLQLSRDESGVFSMVIKATRRYR